MTKFANQLLQNRLPYHIIFAIGSIQVRTVNVFYSNRTVQNVIELKNKYVTTYLEKLLMIPIFIAIVCLTSLFHLRRNTWLMARSCSLTASQSEVKVS